VKAVCFIFTVVLFLAVVEVQANNAAVKALLKKNS